MLLLRHFELSSIRFALSGWLVYPAQRSLVFSISGWQTDRAAVNQEVVRRKVEEVLHVCPNPCPDRQGLV